MAASGAADHIIANFYHSLDHAADQRVASGETTE